jgi:hypothetical protein
MKVANKQLLGRSKLDIQIKGGKTLKIHCGRIKHKSHAFGRTQKNGEGFLLVGMSTDDTLITFLIKCTVILPMDSVISFFTLLNSDCVVESS